MTNSEEKNIEIEVREEFMEAAERGNSGGDQLVKRLRDHNESSPILSGGDVDAAWEDADVGEESVGGDNPTPDQSVVDDLGRAVGLTYQDREPLHSESKIHKRDVDRWEMDPASAEDFRK